VRGVHAPRKTRRGGLEAAAVRPDRNRRGRALAAVPVPRVGETRGGGARLRPIRGDEPARTEKGSGESSLLRFRTAGCGRRCAARRRSVCQPDREHDFTREQWLRNWEARAGVLPGREKDGAGARQRPDTMRPPAEPGAEGTHSAGCNVGTEDVNKSECSGRRSRPATAMAAGRPSERQRRASAARGKTVPLVRTGWNVHPTLKRRSLAAPQESEGTVSHREPANRCRATGTHAGPLLYCKQDCCKQETGPHGWFRREACQPVRYIIAPEPQMIPMFPSPISETRPLDASGVLLSKILSLRTPFFCILCFRSRPFIEPHQPPRMTHPRTGPVPGAPMEAAISPPEPSETHSNVRLL